MLLVQQLGEFDERDIHLLADRRQDHVPIPFVSLRAQVAALGSRRWHPVGPPSPHPADGGHHRHPEPLGGCMPGHAAVNSFNHPVSKVLR